MVLWGVLGGAAELGLESCPRTSSGLPGSLLDAGAFSMFGPASSTRTANTLRQVQTRQAADRQELE
jgi:hypothetical protein